MITKLNTEAILGRFQELISQKVGTADIAAKKRETIELMKNDILKARQRGVSTEDICEVAKAGAKMDNVEITDQMIRAAITEWEDRKPRAKAKKVPAPKKPVPVVPVIPAPTKTSLFDR